MRSRRPSAPVDPASETAIRTVALRLLTVRPRGSEDLARTLERRGFERAAVRAAIERLVHDGWLDDLAAARSVVRARSGRYGRARIVRELAALGFPKETANAALDSEGAGAEQTALRRAFDVLWRRSEGLDPAARRRRVMGALSRKGFAGDAISAMMKGSHEDDEMDIG
ncbi:MAG: regulatory protein RecX [Acidobacteriota bacterium]